MSVRTTAVALALLALTALPAAAQQARLPFQDRAAPAQTAPAANAAAQPAVTPPPVLPDAAPPLPDAQIIEQQLVDYPVFGRSLFRGRFAQQSFRGFNPDYVVSVGDTIDVRLWGAFDQTLQVTVDAQGNVFLPKLGPVHVSGVRNAELNELVQRRVRSVYREDVGVYATLAQSVPVQVYVAGYAVAPGLYAGFASDSVLTFLDRAGGVNPMSGSFLDVRVLRGGQVAQRVNLYDFIINGTLPPIQLHDGDTIFVGPIGETALVNGLVTTPAQYEFAPGTTIAGLLDIAGISGRATNVRVTRNTGQRREVFYVTRDDAFLDTPLQTGDEIDVTADRLIGAIAVSVEGEHEGAGQYILPYDATLQDLLDRVQLSAQSAPAALQLYRVSIAQRQKQVLDQLLRNLERSVLTARSATNDEAELRLQEAELVLQFIERARAIEPRGQVVLGTDINPSAIALEDGDVLRIPRLSNLVAVHGEVFLPNAFVWQRGDDVRDYIAMAGGLIQDSAGDRILLIRQSGEVITGAGSSFLHSDEVYPGDEILVMPGVDPKRFQFAKDIVQIMYQTAVAAGVLVRL